MMSWCVSCVATLSSAFHTHTHTHFTHRFHTMAYIWNNDADNTFHDIHREIDRDRDTE